MSNMNIYKAWQTYFLGEILFFEECRCDCNYFNAAEEKKKQGFYYFGAGMAQAEKTLLSTHVFESCIYEDENDIFKKK